MRKFLVLFILFIFNFLFMYGINYANKVMLKNNFMVYLKEKPAEVKPEDEGKEEEVTVDASYDGESVEQISGKFENVFRETLLSGYGEYMVKHSLNKGVNPYLIGAIILESTNCRIDCSIILRQCNNVSGMREKDGSGCFGGSYRKYKSIEDGIIDLIKKISNDYYEVEMQNPYKMYGSYGKDAVWAFKVGKHMETLKRGG